MPKKETSIKKNLSKIKKLSESDKKNIAQRGKEFTERMVKNVNQKRFFSLEEREQKLLEMSYAVILQLCPELTWEDYLNRLRIANTCNKTTKAVKNGTLKFFHLA
jgi:hypothetical protein